MKNQVDFSPSNVPLNQIKAELQAQRKQLATAIKSFGNGIDVDQNHMLTKNGVAVKDPEECKKILNDLYTKVGGSPNADLAKMMAVNTIEKVAVERQKGQFMDRKSIWM